MSTNGEGKVRRTYGVACQSCKRRKIKCTAEKPACSACDLYAEECVYEGPKKRSKKSAALTIENRIARLESHLGIGDHELVEPACKLARLDEAGSSTRNRRRTESYLEEIDRSGDEASLDASGENAMYALARDEHGQLVYHGRTSLLHDETQQTQPPLESPMHGIFTPAVRPGLEVSMNDAYQLLSFSQTSSISSIDPRVGISLLKAFFSWSSPVYNVVNPKIFLRASTA